MLMLWHEPTYVLETSVWSVIDWRCCCLLAPNSRKENSLLSPLSGVVLVEENC